MELTSRKNDTIRRFRELAKDKKLRSELGVFVIEGDHLCGEAVSCNMEIVTFLCTEKALERYPAAEKLIATAQTSAVISQDIAEYISDTKAPQGLFAEVRRRDGVKLPEGRLVILDGVQDPGNVGTIIRTAEAFGVKGVLLSEKCADIFSPKVLRASMGSVFRLPCEVCDVPQRISALREQGYDVYGSMLDETAQKLGDIRFGERAAIVIGSEGAGISEETKAACTGGLYIPITGAESLNAAAAATVMIWELSKQ